MSTIIKNTFGALLLGTFLACFLSGIVTVQALIYFKLYQEDPKGTKIMVYAVWLLDTLHTCFTIASVWNYLILHFGDADGIDFLPWTLAMTVTITAILTFIVHCFLSWRIRMLTGNYLMAGPIFVLAVCRLGAACVSTTEMIKIHVYTTWVHEYGWAFTLGLSLSVAVDVLCTAVLCYELRSSRIGNRSSDFIIDTVVRYTFESGLLTCAAAVISLVCWITMSYNLIFLAPHFMICKLYANTLLATCTPFSCLIVLNLLRSTYSLNTRKQLRKGRKATSSPNGNHVLPIMLLDDLSRSLGHPRRMYSPSQGLAPSDIDSKRELI